jgi:histidine triad (HIT) family protein
MSSCLFCGIVQGRIPARRVLEDPLAVAFHDVSPKAPVHVLIVPREHLDDLDRAKPEHERLLGHLLLVAQGVARKLELERGYRVVVNRGEDGGQTVNHLHVHVLGGRLLDWPPG